jgi:transcriptional regulator with XRE-family HTH domain
MTDISLTYQSDQALLKAIGTFIKEQRMQHERTQDELAADAAISRSTLSLLERGESVNLSTLIQVLRVLDRLDVLEGFQTEPDISPLAIAREQQKQRYRVRKSKSDQDSAPESDW